MTEESRLKIKLNAVEFQNKKIYLKKLPRFFTVDKELERI